MIEGYTVHRGVLSTDALEQIFDFLKSLAFTRIERPAMHLSRSLQDDNTRNEQAQYLIALLKQNGLDALIDFNDVSVVRYDAASDYVDWHSDGGPLLEPKTQMGVLSFGASRVMEFRRREGNAAEANILLEANDLIVSRAGFQELYQHRIPPGGSDELRISVVLFTHNKQRKK